MKILTLLKLFVIFQVITMLPVSGMGPDEKPTDSNHAQQPAPAPVPDETNSPNTKRKHSSKDEGEDEKNSKRSARDPASHPVVQDSLQEKSEDAFTYTQPIQKYIETPEDHINFLKVALHNAQEKIVIVSPYISHRALEKDGILKAILASQRLTNIVIYTDANFDIDHGKLKPNAMVGRNLLSEAGVDLRIVDRIHTKNIIIDDQYVTFGSFN